MAPTGSDEDNASDMVAWREKSISYGNGRSAGDNEADVLGVGHGSAVAGNVAVSAQGQGKSKERLGERDSDGDTLKVRKGKKRRRSGSRSRSRSPSPARSPSPSKGRQRSGRKLRQRLQTGLKSYLDDLESYQSQRDTRRRGSRDESSGEARAHPADFHFDPASGQRSMLRGASIAADEDREHEFKAVVDSVKPADRIGSIAQKYINAFLNTSGGVIYFGVHDDGTVMGISLDRKLRDDIRLRVDAKVNVMRPQVDPTLYLMEFVPVLLQEPSEDAEEFLVSRFVLEIRVSKGRAPVYFLGKSRVAYVRRDGGVTQLHDSAIEERLLLGRPQQNMVVPKSTSHTLIGRQKEAAKIREFATSHMDESVLIVAIYGTAGVGKSSFARRVAFELQSHYPDARFLLDLSDKQGGFLKECDWYTRIIRLTYPLVDMPSGAVELRALYDSCFHNKRSILLVENAGDEKQVEKLLPDVGTGRCLVLVASRRNMHLEEVSVSGAACLFVELLPLSDEQGVRLLLRFAPDDMFVTEEDLDTAHEVVKACGNLPLAIRSVGAAMSKTGASTAITAKLSDSGAAGRETVAVMDRAFGAMVGMLDPEVKRWSVMSAIFPESFDVVAAVFIFSWSYGEAVERLGKLVDNALLFYNKKLERYTVNELFRSFLLRQVKDDSYDWPKLQSRFVAYYAALLDECSAIYCSRQETDAKDACQTQIRRLVLLESNNLSSAVRYGTEVGRWDMVRVLLDVLEPYRDSLPSTIPTLEEARARASLESETDIPLGDWDW